MLPAATEYSHHRDARGFTLSVGWNLGTESDLMSKRVKTCKAW